MKPRYFLIALVVATAMGGALFAWQRTDQFLIRDPRFALGDPNDEDSGGLLLTGVRHASRESIREVFKTDAGHSVYLFPLAERRRKLLAVEWVKDATVARIWPNRLTVHIVERHPVAFARLRRSAALVDDDGVLLPIIETARLRLPVVTGLSEEQTETDRKERVRRAMKLSSEFGTNIERVSEIDVADIDNLKVVYPSGGHTLTLYLGRLRFGLRLRRYLDNEAEIRQKLPNARVLDLRLEDRIMAVQEGAPRGE